MAENKNTFKTIRKIHIWLSIIVMVPLIIVSTTGLILMFKKQIEWIQPPTHQGSTQLFTLTPEQIIEACRLDSRTTITEWTHIDRLDVRPQKGIIKILGPENIEVQIDASTGAILHIQERNSDFIENIHDGSYFGDTTKYALFVVAEMFFVFQLLTGIYLFVLFMKKRKRKKRV
ncbi:MAG: PepSY domain-containing protein [Fibrobacterales bacterium]